jgi:hypothetical protein
MSQGGVWNQGVDERPRCYFGVSPLGVSHTLTDADTDTG